MTIKLLQKKEYQEIAAYVAVFVLIIAGLINFVGVDFDFKQPEIVLEGKGNFLEIKTTLDQIEENHNLVRFRSFTPIPRFEGTLGRPNPFQVNVVNDSPAIQE